MDTKVEPRNRGLEIFLGILFLILGVLALGSAVVTTMATVLFFGWLLIIGGIVGIFAGLFSGHMNTALLGIFGGALNLIIGWVMVANPEISAVTITLLIGVLLMVVGAYRGIASVFQRAAGWGWTLGWGIITFLLGLIIWQQWPVSGYWVIGVFLGVEFLILGINALFGFPGSKEVAEKSAYA